MKDILVHSSSMKNNSMYEADPWNLSYDLWIYLRDRFYELGYELKTADENSLENCEWVFFFEEKSVKPYIGLRGVLARLKAILIGKKQFRNLYRECLNRGMSNKIVLFLWEPQSVLPRNWKPNLHKLFPYIFTWNDSYIDGEKFIKINFPQPRQFPNLPLIDFKEKKLLVNISMNKTSSHPRELYSERRIAIRYFEQKQPDNFDLFGAGWDHRTSFIKSRTNSKLQIYPSYRGTVLNKWDVLPNYRFSLCYENIHNEPGFITEKIFDCMRSNCVPIYWGAPNITDYVKKGSFIDRRDFKNNEELERYITEMSEQEYNDYQNAIKEYLNSDLFLKFLPQYYADIIIRTLKLKNISSII